MPELTPFESVASLLEQLLTVAKDQLSVTEDQLDVQQDLLEAAHAQTEILHESLQNLQATNTALVSLIAWTKDSNEILRSINTTLNHLLHATRMQVGLSQDILESSMRIEKLLGGTGPVPAPASMTVQYEFELTKKAKEKS